MALLKKEMGNVPADRAPTSPPGADESMLPMEKQPTLFERASLAAKRRAEGGASPPVCCRQQPAEHHTAKTRAHTMVCAVCVMLVTVSAVRYAAGGPVRTHHGSVTQEKTCNELCMSHSSHKINFPCTCNITGQHNTCCAPCTNGKLCTRAKNARITQGGAAL